MTTRQLENKLATILSLSPGEIYIVIDSHGCYSVNLRSSSFPQLFLDYIVSREPTIVDLTSSNVITLAPQAWERILSELENDDIQFIDNQPRPQEGTTPPQTTIRRTEPLIWRQTYESLRPMNMTTAIRTNVLYDEVIVNGENPFLDYVNSSLNRTRAGRPSVWTKCIKCLEKVKIADSIPIRMNNYACPDCFTSLTECERCKKYLIEKEKVIATNRKNYCIDCIYAIGFVCGKDKKAYANKKYVRTIVGDTYCIMCQEKYLATCSSCQAYEELNRFTLCSVCDKPVCRACSSQHGRNCYFRELTEIKFIDGKKENSILPFNRYVGVEIEAERGEIKNLLKDLGKDVGLSKDGSLEDRGVEVQTPPATFDALENMVRETTMVLKKHGYKGTTACGLHLHFDARDIMNDHKKIIQVIKTFYAVEDMIYSMMPPSRWGTYYCKQLNKNYLYKNFKKQLKKNDAEKEIYKETNMKRIKERKNHKYDAVRYYGLNIHSIFFRNTIELRYHSGTIEDYKIINWIDIASRIIDYAINRYDEKQVELMFNLATSYDKFKAFCKLFQLPSSVTSYMDNRLRKFNPGYRILFNKGKEARDIEKKDINKKTKIKDKTIAGLYPQARKEIASEFEDDFLSSRNLKTYSLERAKDLARKKLGNGYFNLPLDGGFIKDEELESIRIFMEQGRQLSQSADGADEAEM